jgi:peptide/nickel transport system permease protein
LAVVGTAMPVFWLGLLLVRIFYSELHVFPAIGRYDAGVPAPPAITQSLVVDSILAGNWRMLGSSLGHLALPALTLGIMGAGLISRVMRASMLEALGGEFIVTARAKGLSHRRIVYVHALRNAMLPTITVLGLTYGSLLGGAVLTEKVFSWPGLGLYAIDAMKHLDFAPVMGSVIVITLAYVIANFIVDMAYGWFDPRVRSARA